MPDSESSDRRRPSLGRMVGGWERRSSQPAWLKKGEWASMGAATALQRTVTKEVREEEVSQRSWKVMGYRGRVCLLQAESSFSMRRVAFSIWELGRGGELTSLRDEQYALCEAVVIVNDMFSIHSVRDQWRIPFAMIELSYFSNNPFFTSHISSNPATSNTLTYTIRMLSGRGSFG